MNYQEEFIAKLFQNHPEIKDDFEKYMVENLYFDPQTDGVSYQFSIGLSFYIRNLLEHNNYFFLKKILTFIEGYIGLDQKIDEGIEILIFESIISSLRGDDRDNGTHTFEDFVKLLGSKSIQLCRKNEDFWNNLDIRPKTLANLVRHIREQDK